jgi:DNA-binding NtrC family response regulator
MVETCSDFRDARARLLARRPDLLVTNIRLDNHNGLHLVHLAAAHTMCIVYATDQDLPLAREAQAAGAFFVSRSRLADAVQSIVVAELPTRDRRTPSVVDRRATFRGGRRWIDR